MDVFLGSVQLFAFDHVPPGWWPCDGALVRIADHPAVFALLGTRFGGDGRVSFGLPDLRDAAPADGLTYCICVDGRIPPRS